MGKHHIIATIGSNIITSKASNIIFAQAKTSLIYHPKVKYSITHYTLYGKVVCKRDEKISSLLILMKNCFTVGTPKGAIFFIACELHDSNLPISCEIGTLAQRDKRIVINYIASMVQNPSLRRCLLSREGGRTLTPNPQSGFGNGSESRPHRLNAPSFSPQNDCVCAWVVV